MKKKALYFITACLLTTLSSCNEWLDVRPQTEQKEEDQFSTYEGFCNALTGCYMSMANQDIYGERLTMTNIESLANLWYLDEDKTSRYEDLALYKHDYTSTYAEDAIQVFYAGLFNTIAQANVIIKNINEKGNVIHNPAIRATIQGEAYAIRAYCQLDVLRLFGQCPQNATQTVMLPYSETTSIYEMPAYYKFEDYITKLKEDINMAESLLKNNDPVFSHSFSELNSAPDDVDDYMYYRQSRLNYWAVKALEARMNLYVGNKDKAYQIAKKEIIDATYNGQKVITLSGTEDFRAGYKLCPSECLFYLSKYDVMTYSSAFLIGGNTSTKYGQNNLAITPEMRTDLYNGQNTNSHNRYLNWWNNKVTDNFGQYMSAITKYFWNNETATNQTLYYQIIPMLRLSEIYLIAMECTTNLDEANQLYKDYMLSHDVANTTDFTSLDDVRQFVIDEYRREFFAEGQMFYTYKRLKSTSMMWRETPVSESEYILPLPRTEFNPNL